MEESSDEDSEFLDLVSQGREDHPLVRFTRMVKYKKSELEYHYNPVRNPNKKYFSLLIIIFFRILLKIRIKTCFPCGKLL